MELKDYYAILEVSPDASADEIKRAYRKLARKTHPDLQGGPEAEAAFKEINQAYDVLKDPGTRAEYDEIRAGGPSRREHAQDWSGGFEFQRGNPEAEARFSDFFHSVFGRGDGQTQARSPGGGDIHARVFLDIEDSYRGATRLLSVPVSTIGPDGRMHVIDRELSVRIPRGITEAQHIRLAGQGVRTGSRVGDLYLEVAFAPHPVYRAEGKDIHMDLPVAPWEAALGGKIVLPTPGGKVELKIPANARSGQRLRLKGKGLPARLPGDLYASLRIVNPRVSTDEARAVFAQMAKEFPFDPRADLERTNR